MLEHLGFVLDTTTMTANLSAKKLRDLGRSIAQLLRLPVQPPRIIMSLTMQIQSVTFALVPAQLYSRVLLQLTTSTVQDKKDWDVPVPLPSACIKEWEWWKANLHL